MSVVYVTQSPIRVDQATGREAPRFNLSKAAEYGEIHVLFPPRAPFIQSGELIAQLDIALSNYSRDNDYLLTLGDPVITAAAVYVLSTRLGSFRVLRWDKITGRYMSVRVGL